MQKSILSCICLAWLLFTPEIHAEVKVAAVIADNMVLQRDTSVPIWGTAAPDEQVTIDFRQQHVKTTADSLGRWQAQLSPLNASKIPATLTIRGKNNSLTVNGILVGEVWLVSGQSNMEFPMIGFPALGVHLPAPIEHRLKSDLAQADCANVRLFRMSLNGDSPTGQTKGWQLCNSASMAPFSAVGFYFAQELSKKLDVPVGILEAAVGGTLIVPWTPSQDENIVTNPADAGFLYTRLVKPLAPYAIRGVLWYQGESNVLVPGAETYSEKMESLIQGWRTTWGKPDLPFEYALLAPMKYSLMTVPNLSLSEQSLPNFWAQQIKVASMPYTSLISTNDLVDMSGLEPAPGVYAPDYFMDLIHPGDKWDVAHRFALVALAKEYGLKDVVYSGPTVQNIVRQNKSLRVDFADTGSGLVSKDGKALTGFEVANADMRFHRASATLEGNSVVVTSSKVTQPIAIRFGWTESSQPNLFNRAGLPAIPFALKISGADDKRQ